MDDDSSDTPMPDYGGCTCKTPRLIVGIDFGATYSGFSYTLQLTCKEHAANRDASFDIRPLQKFQTVLAYGGNPPGFSFTDAPDILSSDYQQSRLFKLLLLDHSLWTDLKQESGIRNYVQSVTHVQQNGQIEVTMVGLWDHASREALSNHLVGRRNIHAVIAFPAIFKKDERAKLAFAKAMKMANLTGNPDVTCIEEHRAALNTTLYWEESPAWPMVMARRGIIVADCGGMTIDAVLYHPPELSGNGSKGAKDFPEEPKLGGAEDFPEEPKLGGAVWLDRLVYDSAVQQISTLPLRQSDNAQEEALDRAMYHWHNFIKHDFSPDQEDLILRIKVARRVLFTFSMNQIEAHFDKIIEMIVDVVSDLWQKPKPQMVPADLVYLTGGLAQNNYVVDRVQKELRLLDPTMPIHVSSYQKSWNTVSVGAVLSQFDQTVLFRHASEGAAQRAYQKSNK